MTAVLFPSSPLPAADRADGAAIYRDRCMNCHGRNGEAKALGRSKPLASQEESAIRDRLDRARTTAPASMQDRIKSALTAEDVEALVAFLNTTRR